MTKYFPICEALNVYHIKHKELLRDQTGNWIIFDPHKKAGYINDVYGLIWNNKFDTENPQWATRPGYLVCKECDYAQR